ncbi:hypothetical protein Herbaro_06020 [Herbaspirillum sp. WKF16]|uniref:hypothetical protein n=1 Tax=Herbaspirillum sp. WKF16 TaxID=3028312 RepID=UPI0023A97C43|nr:hypothetical protein [Herbaspirillum sp. WKF16]WDZ97344.1 hypothetical protein Herbaro_06020 [Herbaspirillum sp. WKF16]
MSEQLKKLRFVRRPLPIFPEHRPLYKIAQILLILQLASWGAKSTLPRLQLLNWALKTDSRQKRLLDCVRQKKLTIAAWGFDPVMAIALRFAEAEKLVATTSTGYQLTETGKKFAREICKEDDNLASEREFLTAIGKSLTEAMVTTVSDKWGEV